MGSITLAALPGRLKTLVDRLTATRAGYLDRLDATITSRASATDYTTARAAKLDNLDAAISSITSEEANFTNDLTKFTGIMESYNGIYAGSATTYSATTAEFWDWVAKYGAYISIPGQGQWATICDVSGSGRFLAAFTANQSTSGGALYLKITMDGTVYQWSGNTGSSSQRGIVMGGSADPVKDALASTNTSIRGDFIQDPSGWATYLPLPLNVNSQGGIAARFKTGLKVEQYVTNWNTGSYGSRAGALYLLDQPTVT